MSNPKSPAAASDWDWRGSRFWGQGILLAWWIGLGFYYYRQPEQSFRWELAFQILPNPFSLTAQAVFRLAKALVALGGLVFMGLSLGGWCLAKLKLRIAAPWESFGFRLGLGWGVIGCLMAVLALLKLWYVGPVMALMAVLSLSAALTTPKEADSSVQSVTASWGVLDIWLGILLALFAAFNLLGTLMPEIFYDALTYHLALPDLYWRKHGFFPTPDNVFSGVPFLIQMLFGLALPLGGEQLAHVLHWFLGLAGALMAYAAGQRFVGRRAGLLAALFYYSNPLVGVMSWKSGVDLGTAFFQFLSVYALGFASVERESRRSWLIVSGAFCGFAMGTKYQAWPLAGALVAAHLWGAGNGVWRQSQATLRSIVPFCLALSVTLAIWPLRNLVLYGNPLFPFFQESVASWGSRIDWRALLRDGGRDTVAMLTTWTGFKSLLLSPWQLSTQQNDTTIFGPIFLLGFPLLLLTRFHEKAERVLLVTALTLWGVWSLTTYLPRYFLPTFLLAAVLFATSLERGFSSAAKRVAYLLVLVVLVTNFFWTATWLYVYEANAVVVGQTTKEDYLKRPHPSYGAPYFACAEYINQHTPLDSRILIVADERGYYLKRDYETATVFGEHVLNRYLRKSATPAALRDMLVADGFTHVLINAGKMREMGAAHWFDVTAAESAVYAAFTQTYLKQAFESHLPPATATSAPTWCAVHEIIR